MLNLFRIQGNISAMRESVPIRFVHHKNIDQPESHVLHINNYLEVYVFVQGNHQYIVENNIYELQRGDIILINPREVHKALPLESCLYERFYLLLDLRCFDGMAHNPLSPILKASPTAGNLISPDPEAREQVLQILYAISRCFDQAQDQQLQALGLVLQLLDICNRQLMRQQPALGGNISMPELLERTLSYVAENTASIQSVAEIARQMGVTAQYLSTYFSKHIGTPLKIYIQAKKVSLAKELLEKGCDVTSACFDSGFNDCSYFIRVFKKYMCMTPLQYQKTMRE